MCSFNGCNRASLVVCQFLPGKLVVFIHFPLYLQQWSDFALLQVVSLTCEQPSKPVELDLLFPYLPSMKSLDGFTVTCETARNRRVYVESFGGFACRPDCKFSLRLAEDPEGYSITLRAFRNGVIYEEKGFHYVPASLPSFHVSTSTSAATLTWKLPREQSLSTWSLYNARTGSLTHVFNVDSSESSFTAKGLQTETLFKSNLVVTSFLKHLNITLRQRLSIHLETAHCHTDWLANGRSCYTVSRTASARKDAEHVCQKWAAGSHLAELKTKEDLLFVSSHLQGHNAWLLMWMRLSGKLDEGQLWSGRSNMMMSSLAIDQTDCFALQRNVTGPGYFPTTVLCHTPLPFICQYQSKYMICLEGAQGGSSCYEGTLKPEFVTERQVELRWSDLPSLNSPTDSTIFDIFLHYQCERGNSHRCYLDFGTDKRSLHE
ncbi:uncharacterized protein LOC144053175 [Vanacampus margaritifer]